MLKKLIMVCGFGVALYACAPASKTNIDAAKLYKTHCVICHGIDGKLGINGAKDLTVSPMTFKERVNNITNGAGTMQAFKDILSKEEIEALAKYTLTLK
ncbi:MAG: cytochrome c [Saprospiraceae bacterium]|nr:cytochrome c [Saprospiraceae bacterium]